MKEDLFCEEFEKCVLCGKLVDIRKTLPIEFRSNYEVGVGQLCDVCSLQLKQLILDDNSIT